MVSLRSYKQHEGHDYFDTYSPIPRINSIRIILGITALRNMKVHQMDVKIAFLNDKLDEEIYIEVVPSQENKVRKLVNSLYDLKQAPK